MAMTCRAVQLLPKALIIISILFLASMWQPMVVAGSAPSGGYRFELIPVENSPHDYIYVMKLKMGMLPETETAPFLAVADTGSDVVWTNQMKMCTGGSPSFSTTNRSCASECIYAGQECHTCIVDRSYGEGMLRMKGFTGMETLALPPGTGTGTDTKKVGLVCATEWTDLVLPTSAHGIVGLNRGPMSLVTQLEVTKFSYCLNDPLKTKATSPLSLWPGDHQPSGDWRSTPLVKIPGDNRYYVELQGICVQNQCSEGICVVNECNEELEPAYFKWKSQEGKGLMMVDSGSTYTHLDPELFKVLKDLLFKVVQVPVVPKDYQNFVLNCFQKTPTKDKRPDLVLKFAGADMRLPWDNYVNKDHCLNIEDATMSILGAMQQQNMHMLYDLAKDKLSFKDAVGDCSEQL